MSTERTPQSVIQAAITAEDAGVAVDWKVICLDMVNAFMAELQRRDAEDAEPTDSTPEQG